jgi:hypothetical protein
VTSGPFEAPEPEGLSSAPLTARLFSAILLRRGFYERVAADPDATRLAAAVVCLAALAYGAALMHVGPEAEAFIAAVGAWIFPLLMGFGLVRWLLFTTVLYGLSRFLLGPTSYTRLLRCIGFGQAPALLSLVRFLGDDAMALWLRPIIVVWLLAATVVACRAALRTSTVRAAAIGVLGFAIDVMLPSLEERED